MTDEPEDEVDATENAEDGAAEDGAAEDGAAEDGAAGDGPVDQMGIPMSREPTMDDVRGDGEAHRRLALGCSVIVTLFVIAFWLVRGYLL